MAMATVNAAAGAKVIAVAKKMMTMNVLVTVIVKANAHVKNVVVIAQNAAVKRKKKSR